jgi:hypothetical protein
MMNNSNELADQRGSSRTPELQPIMLYQNRQVVLSQLSPFSGEQPVKFNRSVEAP